MEQEEDVDEETAEFIPIDSIDVTGDEDEDVTGDEEQLLSSPFTSPKRESGSQKQEKKTSITPILSKLKFLPYTVEFPAKDLPETDIQWFEFVCLVFCREENYREGRTTIRGCGKFKRVLT